MGKNDKPDQSKALQKQMNSWWLGFRHQPTYEVFHSGQTKQCQALSAKHQDKVTQTTEGLTSSKNHELTKPSEDKACSTDAELTEEPRTGAALEAMKDENDIPSINFDYAFGKGVPVQ